MQRYVAFLAGINLGKRRVAMKDLQAHFVAAGLQDVETFIASGNVVFRTAARNPDALEKKLERHLEDRLGFAVETFVRSEAEILQILRLQPFPRVQPENTFAVILLREALSDGLRQRLEAVRTPVDQFKVEGRELFWLTAGGISQSTVWTLPEVRALKLPPSTMRNRNTLERLAKKFGFGAATA